ncbi:MAG: FAD:protein FMN transferase, partial [Aerococcaceae bacterium]|nr:FAD:protein FMN transferase [Aerococcaceae bacterium]
MKKIGLFIFCVLCLVGCGPSSGELAVSKTPLSRSESLLHTAVQLQIYHEGDAAKQAMDEAYDYIQTMEKLWTTNLEGSDVYNINQSAGIAPVKVSPETYALIEKALSMSQLSNGKFDITIGAVTDLWRIGSTDARKPSESEIQAALTKIDYQKVIL